MKLSIRGWISVILGGIMLFVLFSNLASDPDYMFKENLFSFAMLFVGSILLGLGITFIIIDASLKQNIKSIIMH
jgi:hypothetical protein